MSTTLGLDLGPNSIGWALVDDDGHRLVDCGVRVFPEGVDNFDTKKEKPRNEARRDARTMRRQIRRRAARRQRLRETLISVGLFPADPADQQKLYETDPYELRTRALDKPLMPHEIGRVLLHLNQRRGFKSNKKEEAKADSKAKRKRSRDDAKPSGVSEQKPEDILLEMRELEKAIKDSGARTLGEYLYRKTQLLDHANRTDDDHVRGRHTLRSMLMDEFVQIWDEQAKHHPTVLTVQLGYGKLGRGKDIQRPLPKHQAFLDRDGVVKNPRYGMSDFEAFGLFGLIFFHRTLKPVPKEIVGLCELEPGERRCPRADRHAQLFRLLQDLNNLRYIDPDAYEERELDEGQRTLLRDYLATREKASFDDLRCKLGFLESVKFNLERGKRSGIKGMVIDWTMAKTIGKGWHDLPEETKNGVVSALINSLDDDETFERLTSEYGLDAEQANAAMGVDLPEGYAQLSLVAINKLLPHMQRGLVYEHRDPAKSARAQAHYDDPWALRRRVFDKLPDPARTADCPIGDIPNPVVKRTLVELRKVVNAILREQRRTTGDPKWKPDAVHVEMGRNVKSRPKDKKSPAYWKYVQEEGERAERENRRNGAKEKLRENNIPYGAAGRNIVKYLLWEEQGRICIYSGRCISFTQLFTEEVEIDHILPRSQSLDDSQMNLVVCFHEENHPIHGKGQRTPREWLKHTNPAKYEAVCQRAKSLPYPKYKRFLRKEAKLDEFIARQLNDTRYIAKATVEYLRCLFEHEQNKSGVVLGLKGQLTSTLRRLWGLDTILSELPDSPAWQEQNNLRPGEKNRADHRHHVIDAIVIALTNRSRLQKLAKGFEVVERVNRETGEVDYSTVYAGDDIAAPWKSFRANIAAKVEELKVSHRAKRKVTGGLHDQMPFGPTSDPEVFVKRKPVETLSASEVDKIRDGGVKKIVTTALAGADVTFGRGKEPDKKKMKQVLSGLKMPSRVPIKKVRLLVPSKTVQPIRENTPYSAYVNPMSTHHLALFEWQENGKRKRDAVFVTMLEATDRVKAQQQAFQNLVEQHERQSGERLTKRSREYRALQQRAATVAPLIQRTPPQDHLAIPPDATFLFSLSGGEMVSAKVNGHEKLLVYDTAAQTSGQMWFYQHTDARRQADKKRYSFKPNTLNARKVTVDPLGRIRWAND